MFEGMLQKFKRANELAKYINDGFKELVVDLDGTIFNTHIAAYVYKDYLGIDTKSIVDVCAYIPDVDPNKVEEFLSKYTLYFVEPVTIYLLRHVRIPISIKTKRQGKAIPSDLDVKFTELVGRPFNDIYVNVKATDFSDNVCLLDDFPKFFEDYKPRDWDICVKRIWSWDAQIELMPLIP